MARVLMIAYGNSLRGDDGVAWRAADRIDGKFSNTDVEIMRVHQLSPELAENVSRAEAVIFVDAALPENDDEPGHVRCREIFAEPVQTRFSHQLSPELVLSLAQELYFARPRAFAVSVAGECFDHGESLSPAVAASLQTLVARIEALVHQLLLTPLLREN